MREAVSAAHGCLDDLSSSQRRVLTLRAGVGAGPPRSRGGVARRLDITVRRVIRLERTGLSRLRTLARGGACAPPTQTLAAGTTAPPTSTGSTAATDPRDRGKSRSGSDEPRDEGSGDDDSSGGTGGTGEPESEGPPASGGVAGVAQTNEPGGSLDLTIPLILLALAMAAAVVARTMRRRPEPVAAAPVITEEPAEERAPWVPWRRSTMDGPGWTTPPPDLDQTPEPPVETEWSAPPTDRRPINRT